MAEYVRFRLAAAKVGASMALLALVAGVAEKAQAATRPAVAQTAANFLKLGGLTKTISQDFSKLEKKLIKIDSTIAGVEKNLARNYYKNSQINAKFLKISDANLKFLKVDATAADSNKLGGVPASGFFQGKGNVVSGAVPALTGQSQQLLSLPGGIIVVKATNTPGAGAIIAIHNGTANTLLGAVSMGDGSVTQALSLKANADTLLPAVQNGNLAEIHLQIFPGGTFTDVVSILIGLTPNPANNNVPEAVAQAFTGGV